MGIKGRKEGGEGDHPYLSFFLRSFGRRELKEGVLLEIFLRGYNSLGLVLGLGSGVQRGTFGAGWSARPCQLAGWQDWFGLVEFQNLGRTFGYRENLGKNSKQGYRRRWTY